MNTILLIVLVGPSVTLICMVFAGLWIRSDGLARLFSLVLALAALTGIAYLALPGGFMEDEDIANGLLLFMWLYLSFWSWVAAAISLFVLERPADWIIDKLRPTQPPSVEETFR